MSKNILDNTDDEINRQVWFDNEHKCTVSAVWPVATRFLWKGIKGFKSFPYIAFMSPEPDSGKTRALDVVGGLAINPMNRGKYTPAVMLRHVDIEWKTNKRYITTRQDEIDNVFAHGKDNADLIQFYNLGNEERGIVARCDPYSDKILETKVFCPKAFAGLKAARLPDPTKTRTIIIGMRPASVENKRPDEVDEAPLLQLSEEIDRWADGADLGGVEIPDGDISFLVNRNRQLWKPLLIVAKSVSDDWYRRTLDASKHFTSGTQDADKGLAHKILLAAYRVFSGQAYPDRIHSCDLVDEIHELGIPKWVEASQLSDHLSGYDPTIKTRQMKISNNNRWGYEWRLLTNAFDIYISEKERKQVEDEKVVPVVAVAPSGETERMEWPAPATQLPVLPLPTTPATSTTYNNNQSRDMSLAQHVPIYFQDTYAKRNGTTPIF